MELTVIQQRTYKLLQSQPQRFFTPLEISEALGANKLLQQDTEWSYHVLKHLADLQLIEMTATGHFRFLLPANTTQTRLARGRPMRRIHASPLMASLLGKAGANYDGETIEIPDTKQTLEEGISALKERLAARQTNRPDGGAASRKKSD
jgi:hypothetical protein